MMTTTKANLYKTAFWNREGIFVGLLGATLRMDPVDNTVEMIFSCYGEYSNGEKFHGIKLSDRELSRFCL